MKQMTNIAKSDIRGVYDVVIVGAGFSGTMVAVNVLRAALKPMRILLCDRTSSIGTGLAYSTTDSQHLLNVRADQMGAYPDDVSNFYTWLRNHPEECKKAGVKEVKAGGYIPRLLYGAYLQDILVKTSIDHPELEVANAAIRYVAKHDNLGFELTTDENITIYAKQVVLALGNFPPGNGRLKSKKDNPYSEAVWDELALPGDVLIIGTGLTSLDLVMTLAKRKKQGRIHMISRHGLFPQVHKDSECYISNLTPAELPLTSRELLHLIRAKVKDAEVQGIGWRAVIDSLRPMNQTIWETLSEREQRKFLRFLRPYWDTHRHRCSPEIMEVRDELIAKGKLCVHKGHIVTIEENQEIIDVTYRKAGSTNIEMIRVRQLVSCTGPQSDLRKLNDPLVDNLLVEGLVTQDSLKMGVATDEKYEVIDANGHPTSGIYALGSLLKGRLYESVAVPELRVQALEVARQIISYIETNSNLAIPSLHY